MTTRCGQDWQSCYQQLRVEQPRQDLGPVQQPPTTRRLLTLPRSMLLTLILLQKSHRKYHRREKRSLLVRRHQKLLLLMLNQRRRRLVRHGQKKICRCVTHCSRSLVVMTNPGPSCNLSTRSSSQLTRRSSKPRWTSQPSERSSMTACKHSITLFPPFQQFVSIRIVISYPPSSPFCPGTSYGTSFVRM